MLRTSNIDEISQITLIPKSLNRRIKRECKEMENKCDECIVEYTDIGDILVSFKRKKYIYRFNLSINYPFIAPRLTINGLNQNELFDLKTNRFRHILKYITGMDCLCCNTYLCGNNWSPGVTLERVIYQIEEYKTIKYKIFIKLILDKIKNKYLNRDIELDFWLFNIHDNRLDYPCKTCY